MSQRMIDNLLIVRKQFIPAKVGEPTVSLRQTKQAFDEIEHFVLTAVKLGVAVQQEKALVREAIREWMRTQVDLVKENRMLRAKLSAIELSQTINHITQGVSHDQGTPNHRRTEKAVEGCRELSQA